jgi:hypothetical protein
MPDTTELSEVKRALLEKYLRREHPQTATAVGAVTRHTQGSAGSPSSPGSRAALMAIQTGGTKRPFFYAHVDSRAFHCFPLARGLGADQPFYVLEPYRFDGLRVPPTLEAMAAAYIAALRAIQPEGPYLLGGFCAGGMIVYEIARQLRVAGQAVDLLALMEPGVGPLSQIAVCSCVRRIGTLLRLRRETQLEWYLRLRHIYRFLLRSHYREAQRFWPIPPAEALRQDWISMFTWMVSDYARPRPYAGKVTYFWAHDDLERRRAWPKVAEAHEAEVHVIPGTHYSLITDHLHVLSAQLRLSLDKAHAALR